MQRSRMVILFFVLVSVASFLTAQSQDWLWATGTGSTGNDRGNSIVYDGDGYCYITGYIAGVTSFGSTTLNNPNGGIYVAKTDNAGNWVWAVSAGASGCGGAGIAMDANGDIVVTGYFSGSATFGTTNLTSSGYRDIFVAKLSSTGIWIWAVRAGGGGDNDEGFDLATDQNLNIYVTGYFIGTASFGASSITGIGNVSSDIFVAKLSGSGTWIWAQRGGGSSADYSYGIAVDNSGNVFITGQFRESASFGSISLTLGYVNIFVAKLNQSGNFVWVKYTGNSMEAQHSGMSIDVDDTGCIYVTGEFREMANFGGTILIGSWNSPNVFIAKMNNNGTWLWAKSAGGSSYDSGYSIAVDSNGNAYTSGTFSGTATFGNQTFTSNGFDIFVSKLDSSGNWQWTKTAGAEFCRSIAASDMGEVYITGDFSVSATFGTTTITSNGSYYDIYTAKLNEPGTVLLSSHRINFGNGYLGQETAYQPVILKNVVSTDITITSIHLMSMPSSFQYLYNSPDYLLEPGETDTIYVKFTPQSAGVVSDTLYVVNNSTNAPIIRIKLIGTGEYVPPAAVEGVNVEISGYNANLSWLPVTQTIHGTPVTPDVYVVLYNETPYEDDLHYYYLTYTPGLEATHYGVARFRDQMFYKVVAVKFYRDAEAILLRSIMGQEGVCTWGDLKTILKGMEY